VLLGTLVLAIRLLYRILCAVLAIGLAVPGASAQGSTSLVRDAEIETMLRLWVSPIFSAAGLDAASIRIYLVGDQRLNAFVAGGQNVFVNTGTLTRSDSPNQIIGVIAHETGHIAGGHLARSQEAIKNAITQNILMTLLGAAMGAAARDGRVAGAVMGGGQSMALGSLMQFSQTQEASADAAGLTFLNRTGQSARGLLEFFRILEGQELFSAARQDPYLRTHPLTRSRIDTVQAAVEQSKYSDVPDPPEWLEMHRRMKAKLEAFMGSPGQALGKYKESDRSVAARYARAIAYYRIPDLKHAVPLIDELIREEPKNAYFHELKGQMLFENGRIGEALPPYEEAVRLMPESALLRVELAQIQIESGDPAQNKKALAQLNDAIRSEDRNSIAWRLLAIAYGRENNIGMAALALSEQAMLEGRFRFAREQAVRAAQLLPTGSPAKIRAEDLKEEAKRAAEKDKDRDRERERE
jgi:predicted Zn-dependent protease